MLVLKPLRKNRVFVKHTGSEDALSPLTVFMNGKRPVRKNSPGFLKFNQDLPFAFAGIWEKKREKDESIRNTFAIITTEAVVPVSKIHNRMPVILDKKVYENWLNPDENDPKRLKEIIHEGAISGINGYPVSRRVNSVSNNDPSCIEPVDSETNHKQD